MTAAMSKAAKEVVLHAMGNGSYQITTWNESMKMWDAGMGQSYSYWAARRTRSENVASRAIRYLRPQSDADEVEYYVSHHEGSARDLVRGYITDARHMDFIERNNNGIIEE